AFAPPSRPRDVGSEIESYEQGLHMNCPGMETVIVDLARHGAMEVEERNRALAHVAECPRCNARLAEEQRLSDGLLAWSAASSGQQAPPAVEENLLATFRRQPAAPQRGRRWIAMAAAGSIAAAI